MRLQSQIYLKHLLSGITGMTLPKGNATNIWWSTPVCNLQTLLITRSFHLSQLLSRATIYALSSGYGKCGVAVIRVSGFRSKNVIQLMTKNNQLPPPRLARLQRLFDAQTCEPIDKGLLLWFPGNSVYK